MGRSSKTAEPVISDPRLAAELRRLRAVSGRTGDDLAEELGWSPSKVSRVERGLFGISRTDLNRFLHALNVPAERGQSIFALAASVQVGNLGFPGGHFGGASRADGVCDWGPGIVPWTLQTAGYTRSLLVSRQPVARSSPAALQEMADAVAAWQSRLESQGSLRAVISESVLYRLVGSERTMRAQLARLAQPGERAEVRVLPEDRGELVGYDAFTYLEYPGMGELPESASVLTYQLGAAAELRADESVWLHKIAFDCLWNAAEGPQAAIKRALADAWGDE